MPLSSHNDDMQLKVNRRKIGRLSFNAADFKILVSGGVLNKSTIDGTPVEVALLDIGYDVMSAILNEGHQDVSVQRFSKRK